MIITNKSDLTSDYLILRLKELAIPFWRLNTEDYLSKYQIDMHLSNDSIESRIDRFDDTAIETSQIKGVYFRQPIVPNLRSRTIESQLGFAERESLELLRSLWRIIDENLWLNHPKHLLLANNKPDQLQTAVKLGLSIPPTCISTNPNTIRKFYHTFNGDIIAKAVKHGFYKREQSVQVAPTQKVDQKFIENIDAYAKVPMIFQKRIEKEYDVRVTVIGGRVYATAIHSQEHEETKTDWRMWDMHSDVDLKHTRLDLPSRIAELCLELTQGFRLKFSAIDLIYSRDHEYYFLEMNPNGQWVWIEEKVGFPIRDSIINCFGMLGS